MPKKISVLLPNDIFENLRQESLKNRISISDVIREKILHYENAIPTSAQESSLNSNLQNQIDELLASFSKNEKRVEETYAVAFEIRLLFREFLLERNGQVLRKVDQEMRQRAAKEREKTI